MEKIDRVQNRNSEMHETPPSSPKLVPVLVVLLSISVVVIGVLFNQNRILSDKLNQFNIIPTEMPSVIAVPTDYVNPMEVISSPAVDVASTVQKVRYTPGANWTRSVYAGLNLCMPPKWEIDSYAGIYFNRDSGYRPAVTFLKELPYTGGSKREAYFAYWKTEYPDVKNLVTITDNNINGNSVLTIYPKLSESKTAPDGNLAVVFYAGGKLWKAELSNWSMVNDSQNAFLQDFFTMISCSF